MIPTNRPYIAFYNGKKLEVSAPSSYAAAKALKVSDKNRYKIQVVLSDVVHSTASL